MTVITAVALRPEPGNLGDVEPLIDAHRRIEAHLISLQSASGQTIAAAAGAAKADAGRMFASTQAPGVYVVLGDGDAPPRGRFAVGLAAAESRTAPLEPAELHRRGVVLEEHALTPSEPADETKRRQLRAAELEASQKIWRYVLLAGIVALTMETWLAGRRSIAR